MCSDCCFEADAFYAVLYWVTYAAAVYVALAVGDRTLVELAALTLLVVTVLLFRSVEIRDCS